MACCLVCLHQVLIATLCHVSAEHTNMLSRLAFDAMSALVLALTALLGAYLPVYFARLDKLAGGTGRSLTYVLGNMLSAGAELLALIILPLPLVLVQPADADFACVAARKQQQDATHACAKPFAARAAGVMVSAGFCHLLGEAVQQMKGIKMRFPLATFLCGLGYLFTLVADKIAAHAHGGAHGCSGGHGLAKVPAAESCCAVEVLAGGWLTASRLLGAAELSQSNLLHRCLPHPSASFFARNGVCCRSSCRHGYSGARPGRPGPFDREAQQQRG